MDSSSLIAKLKGVKEKKKGTQKKHRFQCGTCHLIFDNKYAKYRHSFKHKPAVCSVCKKKFSRTDNLQRHIATIHPTSKAAKKIRSARMTQRKEPAVKLDKLAKLQKAFDLLKSKHEQAKICVSRNMSILREQQKLINYLGKMDLAKHASP